MEALTPPVVLNANSSGSAILDRNLAAIARRDAVLARRIAQTPSRSDVEFLETSEGALCAQIGSGASAVALCSRRRPIEEAKKFAQGIDIKAAAIFVVLGFGAGHHIAALAQRIGKTGLVMVYEPDVGLLRTVLERVDCSSWLTKLNVAILTDAEDGAAMAGSLRGVEGIVALGLTLIEHPPSRTRIDQTQSKVFHENLLRTIKATKLSIVTTLVQIRATLRNLTQNLDQYVARPGIDELAERFRGRPAVVVSAGPSLARNVELLGRPGVRDNVVIIAAQTVLKTLLARGIKPHVVTALDFSEISARFYEGLTAEDLEGVTLIVEPKANPAILQAFFGQIRCVGERYLDQILPIKLAPAGRKGLESGATVAHLAYYLARFMGCDPVALIGQDLAFTDGQYYAPGAAIHQVWSGELNEFTTLESLEWQRIMRMGQNLIRTTDQLGRPIFTDEQMNSYRVQFERDFARDAAMGLGVYDCTEGGAAKLHTKSASLGEFLSRYATGSSEPIRIPDAPIHPDSQARLVKLERHLRDVRAKVRRVGELSRLTGELLDAMPEVLSEPRKLNPLIDRVHQFREQVEKLEPAYGLVHLLNQTGNLNRIKADRLLQLEEGLTPEQVQARQIRRDSDNVHMLARSADELGRMLDDAVKAVQEAIELGVGKGTRIRSDIQPGQTLTAPDDAADEQDQEKQGGSTGPRPRARVGAVLAVDAGMDQELIRATVRRLRRCRELDAIIALTTDIEQTRTALREMGDAGSSLNVEYIHVEGIELAEFRDSIRGLRALAPECWRGGPSAISCYDHVLAVRPTLNALDKLGLDSVLIVGATWGLVDPGLCDDVIRRHRVDPGKFRCTFTQAPPGVAGAVAHKSVLADLIGLKTGEHAKQNGCFASLGGLLAYVPQVPMTDLIAYPCCVGVEPMVRDLGMDLTQPSREMLAQAERLGDSADAVSIAKMLTDQAHHAGRAELTTRTAQLYLQLTDGPGRDRQMETEVALGWISRMAAHRPGFGLHLVGSRLTRLDFSGDPLAHPDVLEIIRAARAGGCGGVHVRTNLLTDTKTIEALVEAGPDVVSVDVLGERNKTYMALAGFDGYGHCRRNLDTLLELRDRARREGRWLAGPKVICRMTRCDAAYEDVETFFNRWWTLADGCALDPIPTPVPKERLMDRIQPLPLPMGVVQRLARSTVVVRADGSTTTMAEIYAPQAGVSVSGGAGGDKQPRVECGARISGVLV